MMLWALAFAVRDRIPFPDSGSEENCRKASDIPLQCFLPNEADWNAHRWRMETIVQKILLEHLDFLDEYRSYVNEHTFHPHSVKSMEKSTIVSITITIVSISATKMYIITVFKKESTKLGDA